MRLASLSGLGQLHGPSCGCDRCRRGGRCCPKVGASTDTPISIVVSPVQSINSGTQSYANSRTMTLPDGRRVEVPVPPTAGTILGQAQRMPIAPADTGPHGTVYTVKEEPAKDVKYLEFY